MKKDRPAWPKVIAAFAVAGAVLTRPAVTAQPASEIIIRDGLIVTASSRTAADLRIRDGVVAEIGKGLKAGAGAREISAKGKLVLPGGIDPHVHLGLRPGMVGADDYTTGSRAAIAGGVTTIANFVTQSPKEDVMTSMDAGRGAGQAAGDRRCAAACHGQGSRQGHPGGHRRAGQGLHAQDLHLPGRVRQNVPGFSA